MKKYIIILLILFLFPLNLEAYSEKIIVGGENIGITVNTKGILVVGFYKVENKYLNKNNLKIGDYIIKVNDENVQTIEQLTYYIDKHIKDGKVNVTILRNNNAYIIPIDLIKVDDTYKTGLYVKTSLTGIGTITYVDPNTGIFGALGHEILESNTAKKVEIDTGKIYESYVTGINKSTNGNPGSKNALIDYKTELGNIKSNTTRGIYGQYTYSNDREVLNVASWDEIKKGEAFIYTVTKGNKINKYEINITALDKGKIETAKSIAFTVNDRILIEETGGIVQGMSGSPIVQNDKIIGAVTNVVVDNVTKGYAIFIRSMLETGDELIGD